MQTATSGLTLRAAHLSQQRNSGPPLPQRDAIIGLGRLFPSKNPPFRNEHSETLFTCRHLWRSTSALPTVHSTAWVYWVMAIWRLISCRPNEILSALASRGGVGCGWRLWGGGADWFRWVACKKMQTTRCSSVSHLPTILAQPHSKSHLTSETSWRQERERKREHLTQLVCIYIILS